MYFEVCVPLYICFRNIYFNPTQGLKNSWPQVSETNNEHMCGDYLEQVI